MNNYYALIYLTTALKNKFTGWSFDFSISPHKDVWEAYLSNGDPSARFIFSANPSETVLFPDAYRAPKKSNTVSFFSSLSGVQITDINLAENDRFITISLSNNEQLLFRLFGNKPNIFLIRNQMIVDSFKDTGETPGDTVPEPRPPRKPAPLHKDMSAKKAILATDPKFPRHLIQPVIEHFKLTERTPYDTAKVTSELVDLMNTDAEFRVLEDGNLCLVPQHALPFSNLKTFDTIEPALRFVYYKTSRERRLSAKLQSIKPKIDSRIRKTESVLAQLQQAEKGLDRAETYEQYGHLLMARAHEKLQRDTESLTVQNFYDDNAPVSIPVDGSLSIAQNAQRYYDKSTKAIRNVEESQRRLKEMEAQRRGLQSVRKSLEQIDKVYEFDEWYKEHENQLIDLGVLSRPSASKPAPYRKTVIDGYEIWIGKNARSNDHLTSDAHKEDVWMHARGVAGSHLVIRMNNQKEMPPKSILLKAASLAAWNSKARGSGLVPVIVTKKKYVTKPKGSATGAVRIQKEEVLMANPMEIKQIEAL